MTDEQLARELYKLFLEMQNVRYDEIDFDRWDNAFVRLDELLSDMDKHFENAAYMADELAGGGIIP